MAFDVRITGPEFLSEENQIAFLRIEESVRQYSIHSRESIYLVRRPLSLPEDHFVLFWPRGAALVGMYPYGGEIHGSFQGDWESESTRFSSVANTPQPVRSQLRTEREHPRQAFENPYRSLLRGRKELFDLVQQGSIEEGPMHRDIGEDRAEAIPELSYTDFTSIAVFTGPVSTLKLEEPVGRGQHFLDEATFRIMTIEDATARTITHLPNLFRVSDRGKIIYSNAQLDILGNILHRSAQFRIGSDGEDRSLVRAESGKNERGLPTHTPWGSTLRKWKLLLLIAGAVLAIIILRTIFSPVAPHKTDSTVVTHSSQHPPSEMIIELPSEIQLFISPNLYRTRSDLDRALAHGEGQRYLPDTQQSIVMDSITFAKGVYGYFKVDNTWRKGKLLQTLEPIDTVTIVKFLDPLP